MYTLTVVIGNEMETFFVTCGQHDIISKRICRPVRKVIVVYNTHERLGKTSNMNARVNFTDMPNEIIARILDKNGPDHLNVAACVSKRLYEIAKDHLRVRGRGFRTPVSTVVATVSLLGWARDNGCPWNWSTCREAAKGGHLEVLQWAHENGCPWDEWTCASAAESGHLEVLQWARANGCPWNEFTCYAAARGGHLEVLQWARANGCPEDHE